MLIMAGQTISLLLLCLLPEVAGVLWTKGDDVVEKLKENRSYEEVDQADSENEDTLI